MSATLQLVSTGTGEATAPSDPHADTLARIDATIAVCAMHLLSLHVTERMLNAAFAPFVFSVLGDATEFRVYVSLGGELVVFRTVKL